MPQLLLSVVQLKISFPSTQNFEAVKGVSFDLNKGKTLAIVGESGSGKSLIALSIMGLQAKNALVKGCISLLAHEQTILLNELDDNDWQQYRGNVFGMIFQEPMSALNPIQGVGKQIQECILQHQNISKRAAKLKTLKWLAKVKIPNPEKIYYRLPHQLSGGQKQRVMIAMALCNEPKILLADEPTTALDATVQKDIVALMKNLQAEMNTALIFITHDWALAADIADDIMVMRKGTCVEYAPTKQLLQNPKENYTKALLACRPNRNNKGKKLPVISDFLSGLYVPEQLPIHTFQEENTLLSLKDVQVWYPEGKNIFGKSNQFYKAVNGVSFALKEGKTIGLVGESGCGKSTIAKSLIGLAPIQSGQILLKHQNIAAFKSSEWNCVRKTIQLVFQDPYASLNPRQSIGDAITEPLRIHHLATTKDRHLEAERLLDWVQLPKDAAKRYPHQFSGGQRQRIGIARALALQPKILICDESVSALDVSVQAQILNLLKELQYELGLSYLFITHDLSVVHYMADEILVMEKGLIVERGTPDDILWAPQHTYTQRLIAAMPQMDHG
ncbi:MAG: ABC transporter ATP-binding protein [Phycisphaerales bacterium]|nr:ABC transporter ATP-binding protein [Phycisphaerales bacterium]